MLICMESIEYAIMPMLTHRCKYIERRMGGPIIPVIELKTTILVSFASRVYFTTHGCKTKIFYFFNDINYQY